MVITNTLPPIKSLLYCLVQHHSSLHKALLTRILFWVLLLQSKHYTIKHINKLELHKQPAQSNFFLDQRLEAESWQMMGGETDTEKGIKVMIQHLSWSWAEAAWLWGSWWQGRETGENFKGNQEGRTWVHPPTAEFYTERLKGTREMQRWGRGRKAQSQWRKI